MAYQNHNKHHHNTHPYKWNYHMDEYEIAIQEPAAHPKHHQNQKDRVAFRTNYETRKTENGGVRKGTRFGYQNADENVDEEAEAFIQHEHKRMELARLMSEMNAAKY